MKKQFADDITGSLSGFRLPRYHEIPDVGLYLEQTTKYVNLCIKPLGFEDVTGSMIRNYVKQGLISNPVQKQYSADQIAHIIALALLKHVTELENVNHLFRLMHEHSGYSDEVAYNYFCDELENELFYRFGMRDSVAEVGVTSSLVKEMLSSALTAVSNVVYLNRCLNLISEQESAVKESAEKAE